ncbi:MAG: glucose-1-phosphate thymidylyltransferase [Bacteroidales bacterium]|jgi:UDP-N-acetylglucosamine diphosphorylase/glucosamine-1-phosphate N-acetyltransferase|nr:glucose-1-phosphate thymidylyltransferase [Bacteroidales bacterium]
MNYILFDDATTRSNLLPLTFTRPTADLRVGITTIREKWESLLSAQTSTLTEKYLEKKFPTIKKANNILIDGSVIPTTGLVAQIKKLKANQALSCEDMIVAFRMNEEGLGGSDDAFENMEEVEFTGDLIKINHLWDLYLLNDEMIRKDFARLTESRKSEKISKTNIVIGDVNHIFVEKGAKIEGAILNASIGPIYVGNNAEIMEGACIRGPFAMNENAQVKMGAKIYGATTLGPYAKVGGEVQNVIFIGYSNKPHDGYLGNSVVGEWCNIGAGTSSSNLKNTYDEVKLWSYTWETFEPTGQQFCGLFMGDHTKVAIQTSFNTGTVIGVGATVFGSGFQRNFIASFTWGGKQHDVNNVIEVAERMYARRGKVFDEVEADILKNVFKITHIYRSRKS